MARLPRIPYEQTATQPHPGETEPGNPPAPSPGETRKSRFRDDATSESPRTPDTNVTNQSRENLVSRECHQPRPENPALARTSQLRSQPTSCAHHHNAPQNSTSRGHHNRPRPENPPRASVTRQTRKPPPRARAPRGDPTSWRTSRARLWDPRRRRTPRSGSAGNRPQASRAGVGNPRWRERRAQDPWGPAPGRTGERPGSGRHEGGLGVRLRAGFAYGRHHLAECGIPPPGRTSEARVWDRHAGSRLRERRAGGEVPPPGGYGRSVSQRTVSSAVIWPLERADGSSGRR